MHDLDSVESVKKTTEELMSEAVQQTMDFMHGIDHLPLREKVLELQTQIRELGKTIIGEDGTLRPENNDRRFLVEELSFQCHLLEARLEAQERELYLSRSSVTTL